MAAPAAAAARGNRNNQLHSSKTYLQSDVFEQGDVDITSTSCVCLMMELAEHNCTPGSAQQGQAGRAGTKSRCQTAKKASIMLQLPVLFSIRFVNIARPDSKQHWQLQQKSTTKLRALPRMLVAGLGL